ncbi:MAG: hypothetical protein ACRED3_04695 [Bradyrhizobium sp.]
MKAAFPWAALYLAAAVAMVPIGASAQEAASPGDRHEAMLDIDRDGRMDRAVLVRHPRGAAADLLIYLGAGSEALDLSRKPDIRKDDLAHGHVMRLETNSKGSLVIHYGCGGCSNDYETKLTIVFRGGDFFVAGFSYNWETREGVGSCDVNFLTGKGIQSRGLTKATAIRSKFIAVKLVDWSVDNQPLLAKACF